MRCDAAQFSKMYAGVYQDLYRYALCMMKNPQEAEDAVSDAVLAAFENIGKLKNPDAFKSWIFTITTNVCRKKLKALSKKQENETEVTEAVAGSHNEDWGVSIDVQNAFFILTEEEKEIIGLVLGKHLAINTVKVFGAAFDCIVFHARMFHGLV